MKNIQRRSGFTLVEVMVVISIIGILAAAVLFSVSGAKDSGRIGKAKTDLEDIKLALLLYVEETSSMPPGSEHCSLCAFRTPPTSIASSTDWETVIVPDVESEIQVRLPARDPWGNHYLYDNNYTVVGAARPSIICSRGPDGVLDTWLNAAALAQRLAQDDDVCIFFNESDDT